MSEEQNEQPKKKRLGREEIALIEVGHTTITRPVKYYLVAMFLIVIFTVPIVEQGYDAYRRSRDANAESFWPYFFDFVNIPPSREEFEEALRYESVLHGVQQGNAYMLRNIVAYEDALEDESILSKALIPPMQALLLNIGAGNENVYLGRDGWLFFRSGVDYLTTNGFLEPLVLESRAKTGDEWNPPPQPDPVPAIIQFRDQLAANGVDLVIMPAPIKPMLYPEKLARRYEEDQLLQNPSYALFLDRLQQAGIRVCDVAPALLAAKKERKELLYLATDTHWTPAGLDVAAATLAGYLREQGLIPKAASTAFQRVPQQVENYGDVVAMLDLPETLQRYEPESVTIQRVLDADGAVLKPVSSSPILFLGDSFANIYSLAGMGWGDSAGLVEQLSALLQQPLDRILINDNGSHATRQQLSRDMARGNNRLQGKKLVIWEFAMRELAIGDWKLDMPLELGESQALDAAVGRITVEGKIENITRPPKPGDVPYKDCIVALHLTDVTAEAGQAPREMVVLAWGMRDNQWMAAAYLREGQQWKADLVPWAQVEQEYGSYNRVELEDEALLLLDLYWAEMPGEPAPEMKVPEDASGPTPAPVIPAPPTAPAPGAPVEAPAVEVSPPPSVVSAYLDAVKDMAETAAASEQTVVRGKDDWLFYLPSLRSLSIGPFWGAAASKVSRASNPAFADPFPAIVDFHKQLKDAGIRLVVVPVPSKAAVYPDKLRDMDWNGIPPRIDHYQEQFYRVLREADVEVLDLTPVLANARFESNEKQFCQSDTHWAGAAVAEVARQFAAIVRDESWYEGVPKRQYTSNAFTIEAAGDLWRALEDPALPQETLALERVEEVSPEGEPQAIESWRESPVMLLGDSHLLIFSAGDDMLAEGAGLPEHVARELGFPADVVAVRGSGATPARISLVRRRDNLEGKKIVFWCFTAREFTEAEGGWRVLPVIAK